MSSASNPKAGVLWVAATPLGNPGDLSPRAQTALAGADCILAEDTRRSGLLFAALGIKPKRFISLHDHNEEARIPAVLGVLAQGQNLALVSDAGTPLLSDPGYRLVRACREAGFRVIPLPGPSAVVTALSASGLPPLPFVFLGFPPRKKGEQKTLFAPYIRLPLTLVFFERKDRLRATLELAFEVLGPREACVAREMTKTYEEFINFRLGDRQALPDELLGEITVVIGPPGEGSEAAARPDEAELRKIAARIEAERGRLKRRDLARMVKESAPGWGVDEIYSLLGK